MSDTMCAPDQLAGTVSKHTAVVALLSRAEGGSLAAISVLTGWKPASIRAFITRLRIRGMIIDRYRQANETVYRIRVVPQR